MRERERGKDKQRQTDRDRRTETETEWLCSGEGGNAGSPIKLPFTSRTLMVRTRLDLLEASYARMHARAKRFMHQAANTLALHVE